MKVTCIDSMGVEQHVRKYHVYEAIAGNNTHWNILLADNTTLQLEKNRFEIYEEPVNSVKYYYYEAIFMSYCDIVHDYSGVIESKTGHFPLRKVNDIIKNDKPDIREISYKLIVEISKEDFEWQYADMSKFRGAM